MRRQICAIVLALGLLAGCTAAAPEPQAFGSIGDPDAAAEVAAADACAARVGAWSAYWDCEDDVAVVRDQADALDDVVLFAAYFRDGGLYVPPVTCDELAALRDDPVTADKTVYLSVVNDVEVGGTSTQKDVAILHDLLDDEETARAHAADVVRTAASLGFDGVEIDYEKIRGDLALWDSFVRFEGHLMEEAREAGLAVRVVLEPSTPVDQVALPAGPEYVVMCYNLHGSGTEPGPKADLAFLDDLAKRFADVPDVGFALADGGYAWEEGSDKATQVRGPEAVALARDHGVTPERDEKSGALTFSYVDAGRTHVVWYADADTIASWAERLAKATGAPCDVSLWRL